MIRKVFTFRFTSLNYVLFFYKTPGGEKDPSQLLKSTIAKVVIKCLLRVRKIWNYYSYFEGMIFSPCLALAIVYMAAADIYQEMYKSPELS